MYPVYQSRLVSYAGVFIAISPYFYHYPFNIRHIHTLGYTVRAESPVALGLRGSVTYSVSSVFECILHTLPH